MSNQVSVNNTVSMPVLSILGVVFIVLKLTGHIDWSWWWVLAPFWLIPIAWVALVLVALVFAALTTSSGRRP